MPSGTQSLQQTESLQLGQSGTHAQALKQFLRVAQDLSTGATLDRLKTLHPSVKGLLDKPGKDSGQLQRP